ncbi:hypothetical protein [Promicromonospora sukumoe]|uniref:hypothetical protein n=1 Tax=Promicromonospora sukumoe TaxID=88382 RepID=UPI000370CF33|nr:hypothetical protein [Promicromonospora sukumoe]
MSSTWRWSNRALLLVCGLLLVAAGGAAVLLGAPSRYTGALAPAERASSAARWSEAWAAGLPDVAGLPGAQAAALAAAVVLLVLLLVFLRTRGGGRTPTVVRLEAQDGRTTVDQGVARALLADPLAERADVLSARTGVHRVKGAPAICLTVIVRRGADLAGVLAAAEAALADWDELAGVRVPVLVHLADRRWRDGLHARTRVR